MENNTQNPEEAYTTNVVIWAALLMSQLMFFGLIYMTKPELFRFEFTQPILGGNSVAVAAIAAIAVTSVLVSFVMRGKFLKKAVDEQNAAHVQTALVVGCAFCEAASLFGILLAFAFNYQYFFVFLALGVIGTLLHFPRRDDLHAASFKKI